MGKKDKLTTTRAYIEQLPKSKQEIAYCLVDKAEFIECELTKLQEIIKVKGWTEEYTNGANQCGVKKCSEGEMYNTLIKNYNSIIKALNDMLPNDTGTDGFDEWVTK